MWNYKDNMELQYNMELQRGVLNIQEYILMFQKLRKSCKNLEDFS